MSYVGGGKMLVVGIPAFNNLKYTIQCIESITTKYDHEILIINNGSTDDTEEFLIENRIPHVRLDRNMGYSYAMNILIRYAYNRKKLLLTVGNDTVMMPYTIDYLVRCLENNNDWMLACGTEITSFRNRIGDPSRLRIGANGLDKYPIGFGELEDMPRYIDYGSDIFNGRYYREHEIEGIMNHNCLIRRPEVFDIVGEYDTSFYPAYFEDNDFAYRVKLSGLKYGGCRSALFFHYWSRSIYEGGLNNSNFEKLKRFFVSKWGGMPGHETFNVPFNDNKKEIRFVDESMNIFSLEWHFTVPE